MAAWLIDVSFNIISGRGSLAIRRFTVFPYQLVRSKASGDETFFGGGLNSKTARLSHCQDSAVYLFVFVNLASSFIDSL